MPEVLSNFHSIFKFDEIQFTDVNNVHVDDAREVLDGDENICIS